MAGEDYNVEYWTEQEKVYLKQLAEEPEKVVLSHKGLAMVYNIMSRFDECFLHCNKVLELSKNNTDLADAHIWMARSYKEQKEYNPAIAHYLKAIEKDPEHDAALAEIGESYIGLKDFTNAEYWFNKLTEVEGSEDYGWTKLAELFIELKDFDSAQSYYEKCLVASPEDIEALCGKGRCLAEKKLYPQSIEVFNKVAELYPEDALPEYYLGVCYQNTDDQYRAMHHYMKAVELDPDFAEAYNNIGKLYFDYDGDTKTAIDYLEKALTSVNNTQLKQMLYINLSRLNQKISNYDRSDYYKSKLLDELGFGGLLSDEDGDDEEDE